MRFIARFSGMRNAVNAGRLSFGPHHLGGWFSLLILLSLSALIFTSAATAQTTVGQGSIQGAVTDPTGAVVSGAKITMTNRATGQVATTTTNSSGTYNSGGLSVGDYSVRMEAKGFKTTQFVIPVQVAVTSAGSVKLEVGQESTIVEVQGAAVGVNTEQATVQGVLTGEQIDNLPVNGRNFLDLAQLEPGVQMQDGTSFDPTKAGYTSVSINGVFGRTPRIEVDGLDVSDETVGTTTQNIAMSSIQEFNISRSSLDLSTEVTSSGAVNVAIRSGTNSYHGQALYNFRDQAAGFANFPGGQSLPFQRNQFGGRFGGALIKDKLFFFVDAERIKQDSLDPVVVAAPFDALSGGFSSPFRSTSSVGKLDWQATNNIHVFYKFAYDVNYSNSNAFATGYSIYANRDNTPSHAIGVDWNKGSFSNSFRFGYLKFHNMIVGGTSAGATAQNPFPGIEMFFFDNGLTTGPNFLAPQQTYQSNKQFKYDGSKVWGSHIIRFGAGVNRILGGGFASFYGLGPEVVTGTFGGSDPNPGNYPFLEAVVGNGQGYFTEKPSFGAPAGGQADTRFEWYVGDSWKVKPNLTLTYGLRYLRDTGRQDSDIAPIPCSATSLISCTGNLLDQFGFMSGLGNRIRQPNSNFGPQVGFAWDPAKNGKTVIRGGAGIYYENSVFNNVLFDRPPKLSSGLFWNFGVLACGNGGVGSVGLALPGGGSLTSVDGADVATQLCGLNLGAAPGAGTAATVAQALADYQTAWQAAIAAAGPASNVNFLGNTLELSSNLQGYAVYAPNYRTPRSYQMNLGIQREIVKGGVFSADYVRNISLHFPLTIDVNHVGDSRYLNTTAALNAIAATTSGFGCSGTNAAAIDCAINAGAGINDFAANGLDSGVALFSGSSAPAFGVDPSVGAAFAGINPLVGVGDVQFPAGRSVYNGLQTEYKQQVRNPFRGVTGMNLQIAYTLSRFQGNGGNDQNFSALAWDQRNPTAFFGPTTLDRTNQFKFGVTFDVAHHGPRFSVIGGFSSARPSNLSLPITNGGNQSQQADIFRTDLTGDGTIGDLINSAATGIGKPGTFMRGVSASDLNSVISNFNTNVAGTLTPAGKALVSANLFTQAELTSLGAVITQIAPPPAHNAGNTMYRDVDAVLAWPIKLRERFTIEPSFSVFNLFNFSNFGPLNNTAGWLTGGPGSANGTVAGNDPTHNVNRSGLGTGVFALGAPRQAEFGLRLTF
jgi:Carboxypeptidase regulatory-like domain